MDIQNGEGNKISVSFSIRHDGFLNISELSEALQIQPTWSFVKDESYESKAGMRKHPWSLWGLDSASLTTSDSVEEHVLAILQKLEPVRNVLQPYIDSEDYCIRFRIWWQREESYGGYDCSSCTMARMSSLCDELSFNFICMDHED